MLGFVFSIVNEPADSGSFGDQFFSIWVYLAGTVLLLKCDFCTGLVFLFYIFLRSCLWFARYLWFYRLRDKKKLMLFFSGAFLLCRKHNFSPFWYWFFIKDYCKVSLAQMGTFLCGMLHRLFFILFQYFQYLVFFYDSWVILVNIEGVRI